MSEQNAPRKPPRFANITVETSDIGEIATWLVYLYECHIKFDIKHEQTGLIITTRSDDAVTVAGLMFVLMDHNISFVVMTDDGMPA